MGMGFIQTELKIDTLNLYWLESKVKVLVWPRVWSLKIDISQFRILRYRNRVKYEIDVERFECCVVMEVDAVTTEP